MARKLETHEDLICDLIRFLIRWGLWDNSQIWSRGIAYGSYQEETAQRFRNLPSVYTLKKEPDGELLRENGIGCEKNEEPVLLLHNEGLLYDVWYNPVYIELDLSNLEDDVLLELYRNVPEFAESVELDMEEPEYCDRDGRAVYLDHTEFDSYDEFARLEAEKEDDELGSALHIQGFCDRTLLNPVVRYIMRSLDRFMDEHGLRYAVGSDGMMACYYKN